MKWVLLSTQLRGVLLTFEAPDLAAAEIRIAAHAKNTGRERAPAHWYWCPEVDMPDQNLDDEISRLEDTLREWDGNREEKARQVDRLNRLRNDRAERERNS